MPQASAIAGGALLGAARGDECKQHGNQHDVQQRRREGGDGEAAIGIEHAGIERDQRHEGEIRQRDAREQHGEREFLGVAAEAGRQQQHQPRHGDLGEDGEGDEQDQEAGKRLTGKGAGRLGALGMQALGEERNERRVESALGEQPAKHIGHAEGDEVGVGRSGCAEHRGDQHVAREAEHAAQDRHRAYGGEAAIKPHQAGSNAGSGRAASALSSRSRMDDSRLLLVIFLPVRSVT